MKKVLGIACALCIGVAASAQNEQIQNKKGVDIMPVSGEYSVGIGVGLNSVTGWIGSMFGYTGYNSFSQTYVNNPLFSGTPISIWGKYMVSDDNALRMSLSNTGIDNTNLYNVFDDRSNNPDSMVVDKRRINSSTTYLSAGWEFRRGKTRLRGLYGGDAVISWANSHDHFVYGNSLTAGNLTPTQAAAMPAWNATWGRTTQVRNGATFGIGVRAFVGVEYFIAPKICIGTEFGWSARYEVTGESKVDYERFDPFIDTDGDGSPDGAVRTHTETTLGSRTWSTGLDNFNTQLYFNFYF
ncbi:MAG: hypothetical protein HUJ25_10075 [Crocinitomicaceae bacterium]|nr:hypothetical protein [Crocinitomicaceae bacterium]